ncbi:MAG TPA: winged helix-turn-helix domain-containing protein [Candidatus Acidoferrum sp.]|nr:winged helix-turn-helix domain-containing protein [Candidatus Acidoferrum sp.]
MNQAFRTCYVFGEFCLDSAERRLVRGATPISITPKIFDTLLLLVENAGHLVEKDEFMKQLWPGTFVGEDALARNISILRKTLGESNDSQSFIATVPTRGYRFVAPVEKANLGEDVATREEQQPDGNRAIALPTDGEKAIPQESSQAAVAAISRPLRRRIALIAAVLAVGSFAGLVTFYVLSPGRVPSVRQTVQLTHFAHVDTNARLLTDGARLYFVERRGGQFSLAQVPTEGGEPTPITTPFRNTWLYDISPDRSNLLVGSNSNIQDENSVWVLPTSGRTPRRLGEVMAHDAAWSPDGQTIVYALGSDLYLVKPDGSDSRKLVNAAGLPMDLRWSPDGHVVRFTVWGPGTTVHSLWEISADGRNLHRLLAGWRESPTAWGDGELAGGWTPDGKYFIFRSGRAGGYSVWALRENGDTRSRGPRDPLLLTTSALYLRNVLPGQNGRVFFAANKESRELARYDARLKQFVPYLSGVPARYVSFSRDGQWVAYVTMPESILWRSRVDGSERLQLTLPGMGATDPQWSPDAEQIAFVELIPGGQTRRIYLISSAGGTPEATTGEAFDALWPGWSLQGDSLLFQRGSIAPSGKGEHIGIYQIDLKTKQQSLLPGSEGFQEPARSPDGRYVAALANDSESLMLFDSLSQRWTELAKGLGLFGPAWSRDSKYVYSQDVSAGSEQPIFRVRISDRKAERIATASQILRADVNRFYFLGLAPDGSPLVTLTHGNSDIYALDVDFP